MALWCNLLSAPFLAVIVFLFKHSRARQQRQSSVQRALQRGAETQETDTAYQESEEPEGEMNTVRTEAKTVDARLEDGSNGNCSLPAWCLALGWVFCLVRVILA